ncbi:MAG: phosphoribosyl-AMP cyclohydrolase [Candidatus Theseobacter exili]|nr:phosphoribosyl-AMP cyclohydrolase [Candidatus Theseobacter exili]
MSENKLDWVKFDERGLLPAIVQDAENGVVLMVAYMNKEALDKTIETGKAHFWSRSRKKLWAKGETSGHVQNVQEILFDCDLDTVVLFVEQIGGACHKGYRSCFFRKLDTESGELEIIMDKIFDPDKVY